MRCSFLSPLGHGHGGASSQFGDQGELVHQTTSAGQAHPQPVVGAVPVPQRTVDVCDARARCRSPSRGVPAGVVQHLDEHLPLAGEPDDVARYLRDSRRNDGLIRPGKAQA